MTLLKKIWRPLIALILILILIQKGPFQIDQLKLILSNPRILILGLIIFLVQILLFSFRWRLFVNLVGPLSYFKSLQLTLIGYFFNHFIPGGVGGDIVKALELSKNKTITRTAALSTVMSDRIFGLFAMISFTFLFLAIEYSIHQSTYLINFLMASAFLFIGILLSLLFLPHIFQKISQTLSTKNSVFLTKIEKLISSLNFTFTTFRNPKVQVQSFLISLVGQLLAIYFMYEVVRIAGVTQPSFFVFFALCCFGFLATAIPIFPAGIGVGQYAFFVIFSHISNELGQATITAITALQIFNFSYALIGGMLFSFMSKLKDAITPEAQ